MDLLTKRAEADSLREKQYKEFYRNIEDKQDIFQNKFAKEIIPTVTEKKQQLNNWVEKNIEQKNKLQKYKDLYEQKVKQDNINNIKSVWKYQIEEKQKRMQDIKEEQRNLYDTVQRQINESKRLHEIRENERRIQQHIYKENLLGQSNNRRQSSSKIRDVFINPSDHSFEKITNKERFESVSSKYKSRSNSVSGNYYQSDPPMYSGNPYQIPDKAASPSGSNHSALSTYSLHNPITNPIGSYSPKPIDRPLFKPHTLIAY